jgi:hypothetical protein
MAWPTRAEKSALNQAKAGALSGCEPDEVYRDLRADDVPSKIADWAVKTAFKGVRPEVRRKFFTPEKFI